MSSRPNGPPPDAPRIEPHPKRPGPPRVRPVTVDEHGRVFNEQGEQIVVPGMEPEVILRALAEDAAGHYCTLEEAVAEIKAKRNESAP